MTETGTPARPAPPTAAKAGQLSAVLAWPAPSISAAGTSAEIDGRPVVCRACLAGAIDFCRCSGGGTGRGTDAVTGCNSVWVASGRDALDASASAAKGNTITGQSKSSPSPQKQKRALPILDSVVSICKNTALG